MQPRRTFFAAILIQLFPEIPQVSPSRWITFFDEVMAGRKQELQW